MDGPSRLTRIERKGNVKFALMLTDFGVNSTINTCNPLISGIAITFAFGRCEYASN